MKVTVCELPDSTAALEAAWSGLIEHLASEQSDLLLLPEMPFHPWLAGTREVDPGAWLEAVAAHDQWLERLPELGVATVLGSRPVVVENRRYNEGFVWEAATGYRAAHLKYYLPDEEGFWEATWYERGDGTFEAAKAGGISVGFQICTDLWFTERSRALGKQGVHLIAIPRATPRSTLQKWVVGGRVAAVVSGTYCLSSNRITPVDAEGEPGSLGWIVDPEGEVLAVTPPDRPFVTVPVDRAVAETAKETYPRYVRE
jgi:N-carbamoylputrescine amidase